MNKYLIGIIILLLAINVFAIANFLYYRKNVMAQLLMMEEEGKRVMPLEINLRANMENNARRIQDISGKNQKGELKCLHDFFDSGMDKILVCRFSELDCESCIDFTIKTLLGKNVVIEKDNILFVSTYKNDVNFNRQKQLYGIQDYESLNIMDLGIPLEDYGYPYYFILDKSLQVLDVFVPSKSSQVMIQKYFDEIQEKHFSHSIYEN